MDKIKYNNYEYDVIDKVNIFHVSDFEIVKTNKTIIKEKFAIIPYYINGKFAWFKKVKIRYKLCFSRKLDFDDGWTYKHFWTKWKPEWELIDIIN